MNPNTSDKWHRGIAWALALGVVGLLVASSLIAVLDGADTQYIRFAQAALYSIAIWVLLLAAVRRVWLALVIALPVAILVPMEIWMRLEIGFPTDSQTVALLVETSAAEAANFAATYGGRLALWWAAWALLYGAAVWRSYRFSIAWRNRANTWCLLLIPAFVIIQYAQAGAPPWISEVQTDDPFDGRAVDGWSREWEEIFPVNIVAAFQHYGVEMRKLQRTQAALEEQTLGAQMQRPETAPEVVVLIVGESATASRWGLLGYHRKTTPRLSAEDGLIAFSDVVGLSGATRSAVPGVLSRRPVLRPDGVVDSKAEPSIIKAYREVGYRTHWFSNQSPFGKFDAPIAVYAREAEEVRFFNPSTFRSKSNLDEILIHPLKAALNMPGRHLVVLHTLGSHFEYALRYPDSFDHFRPSMKNQEAGAQLLNDANERISNSYDNSVLYTDHFLAEVISTVKARGGRSVVAYFSDHGVDLPGGKCRYSEETRQGETTYRVPALFWLSDKMRQEQPDKWQQLQKHRSAPYTTGAMYSSLLELGGIKLPGDQSGQSFLRQGDPKNNPRWVGAADRMVDFDRARAHNACKIASYR